MSILDLKILHNKKPLPLPVWIKFAFGIGAFLTQEGVNYGRHATIAVSLPSDRYFAVLAACGIADKEFSERKQVHSIREQILALNPGSRVILNRRGQTKKVSVVSVEKHPYTDEMLLYIQDGNVKDGVPERSWMDSIALLDEEFDEIKRSRRVNKKIGITSSLVNSLYTKTQMSGVSFFPGEEFYLIGNRNETEQFLKDNSFIHGDVIGSPGDFIYIDGLNNNSSYTNGKFFSSQTKRFTEEINGEIPVLYSDIGSFRRLSSHFVNNPSLIVISRTDHEHRIHEAQAEISRKLIQEKGQLITLAVMRYLWDRGITVPDSVELIAWREG